MRQCAHHQGVDPTRILTVGVGAFVGHMVRDDGVGAVVGALAGYAVDRVRVAQPERKRVFLSFDFDHDQRLKHLFVGQAKNPNSPFEITDFSLQEAAPERDWEYRAALAIHASQLVVVLLGRHTARAHGVLKEVRMAKQLGVPIVQVIGHRGVRCPRIQGAGRVCAWDWDALRRVLD